MYALKFALNYTLIIPALGLAFIPEAQNLFLQQKKGVEKWVTTETLLFLRFLTIILSNLG